eukprot:4887522-Pyramimonas_sp.AAC.2
MALSPNERAINARCIYWCRLGVAAVAFSWVPQDVTVIVKAHSIQECAFAMVVTTSGIQLNVAAATSSDMVPSTRAREISGRNSIR